MDNIYVENLEKTKKKQNIARWWVFKDILNENDTFMQNTLSTEGVSCFK